VLENTVGKEDEVRATKLDACFRREGLRVKGGKGEERRERKAGGVRARVGFPTEGANQRKWKGGGPEWQSRPWRLGGGEKHAQSGRKKRGSCQSSDAQAKKQSGGVTYDSACRTGWGKRRVRRVPNDEVLLRGARKLVLKKEGDERDKLAMETRSKKGSGK